MLLGLGKKIFRAAEANAAKRSPPQRAKGLAPGSKEPLILWSASCRLKFEINQRYYRKKHYCWCSPVFEAAALGRFEIGSNQPRSSDPASIYRDLMEYQRRPDGHDEKIASWRKGILEVAVMLCELGDITELQRGEIALRERSAGLAQWKPLMYVIPFDRVRDRVEQVPLESAASSEPEYIVSDLFEEDFEIVEF